MIDGEDFMNQSELSCGADFVMKVATTKSANTHNEREETPDTTGVFVEELLLDTTIRDTLKAVLRNVVMNETITRKCGRTDDDANEA
jgi:hypothetical protein